MPPSAAPDFVARNGAVPFLETVIERLRHYAKLCKLVRERTEMLR